MATFNVTSMRGFIDALTSLGDGDIINVQNDLDFNEVLTEELSTIRVPTEGYATNCTINGNDHAIYNLTDQLINSHVFNIYAQHLRVNNLQILNYNMMFNLHTLFQFQNLGNTDNIISGGVFQGKLADGSSLIYGASVIVQYCMATFSSGSKGCMTGYPNTQAASWKFCWVKFDGVNASATAVRPVFGNADTCYFEGMIRAVSDDNRRLFQNVTNCCVNCSMRASGVYSTPTLANLVLPVSSALLTIVNESKYNGTPLESSDSVKWVTDSQMKDSEYLAELGFNIVH